MTTVVVSSGTAQAAAANNPNQGIVTVEGGLLNGITTSPMSLRPAFSVTITDYVVRCQAGINTIQFAFSARPGATIKVESVRGQTVNVQETLAENQALIVSAVASGLQSELGSRVDYWIRCLPHDFPALQVTKPGQPNPGWYLTGNANAAKGSEVYAMVLDNNGTPVWYRKSALPQALNVTAIKDGSIMWSASGESFEDFNLKSQMTRWISAPVGATDFHELQQLSNGDLMMLSNPLKPGVNLTPLGLGTNATILDCVLQEVDSAGKLRWQWRAIDNIAYAESTHPFPVDVARQLTYDPYHCNSIDVDPGTGDLLVSARHTDAIYRINKSTGALIWKLGGNSITSGSAQHIAVVGDPDGAFHAQHDARFQGNSNVSLYDNQTWDASLAARAVVYHIDLSTLTASMIWSYSAPDGQHSAATGSFRVLANGMDNVIGWGVKPNSLFTEVDARGQVLLDVRFSSGEIAYRAIKIGTGALDRALLQATAGLPPFVLVTRPSINYLAPPTGSTAGGNVISIMGSGFAGATAVKFGSVAAPSFTVQSDSLILAVSPGGGGSVTVTVTGPGGTSPAAPVDQLATSTSDSSFTNGTGSWSSNVNALLSPSTLYMRSQSASLQITPEGPGFTSAFTGQYPVLPGAQIVGNEWVLTPSAVDSVRAFLIFYNSDGTVLLIDQPPVVSSSASTWTQLSVSGLAPDDAVSVSFGIDDVFAVNALYVDDASLTGSDQYSYQ